MTDLSVSVVVVSHDRPTELRLCLKALTYQYRRNFEIVVVYNSGSEPGLEASGLGEEIKSHRFDARNISAARNIGINMAAGEIVAFIDDDAIAEPTWLDRLIKPFSIPEVVSTGGFVRGRNGFDLQWAGQIVDDFGRESPCELSRSGIIRPKPGAYAKTHGTNCAFRRKTLQELSGFDEAFHYFLDETDLNIRIGKAEGATALVPHAQVHHFYAPSLSRQKSRAPKSLFDIGASTAYFLKKHNLPSDHLDSVRRAQHRRLKRFVLSAALEPHQVNPLLNSFDDGVLDGKKRDYRRGSVGSANPNEFLEFRPCSAPKIAKYWSCRRLIPGTARQSAQQSAANGDVATLLQFSWTSWRHRRGFHPDGYWFQIGGLFGKSDRSQPRFQIATLRSRTDKEIRSLRRIRDNVHYSDT